jgi:hypothetical protein
VTNASATTPPTCLTAAVMPNKVQVISEANEEKKEKGFHSCSSPSHLVLCNESLTRQSLWEIMERTDSCLFQARDDGEGRRFLPTVAARAESYGRGSLHKPDHGDSSLMLLVSSLIFWPFLLGSVFVSSNTLALLQIGISVKLSWANLNSWLPLCWNSSFLNQNLFLCPEHPFVIPFPLKFSWT